MITLLNLDNQLDFKPKEWRRNLGKIADTSCKKIVLKHIAVKSLYKDIATLIRFLNYLDVA
jgi:hypothetical protein